MKKTKAAFGGSVNMLFELNNKYSFQHLLWTYPLQHVRLLSVSSKQMKHFDCGIFLLESTL